MRHRLQIRILRRFAVIIAEAQGSWLHLSAPLLRLQLCYFNTIVLVRNYSATSNTTGLIAMILRIIF